VRGPGIEPQLAFACCENDLSASRKLLAEPATIGSLKRLHAEIAIPIADFSPERTELTRELNQAGIPVIAWMLLDKKDGIYLNADTAAKAGARIEAFEEWTRRKQLKWNAVGLDIEPNFAELGELKGHWGKLIGTLVRRGFDGGRIERAKESYRALIGRLQSDGFVVQTYIMPYVPAERSVHSTFADRLLGTVDVRGNEEVLMLYTSFARPVGAAMIYSLGQGAQGITVGVTDGNTPAGVGAGPLNWDELHRDLIVASHFSKVVGIYDIEGCLRQDFLPRLETMDWGDAVTIPRTSISRARRMGMAVRAVLWAGSHFVYLAALAVALLAWIVWRIVRWRGRRRKLKLKQAWSGVSEIRAAKDIS
jgi:hypothetical protein